MDPGAIWPPFNGMGWILRAYGTPNASHPENSHAKFRRFLRDNDDLFYPPKKLIAGLTFFGGLVMITAIFLGGIGGCL